MEKANPVVYISFAAAGIRELGLRDAIKARNYADKYAHSEKRTYLHKH